MRLNKYLFLIAALLSIVGVRQSVVVAQVPIVLDDFNDDMGELNGETVSFGGQTWAFSAKAETQNRSLTTGTQFGQSGTVGAGDAEPTTSPLWKGNMIQLGQQLGNTPGTYTLSADLLKDHKAGLNQELNLILRSSTQGPNPGRRETVITYTNDKLKTGGNWFHGLDESIPDFSSQSIHVDLTLELVPGGGLNSATLGWFDIGSPSNNGSFVLPNAPTGTLLYDEIHLLTKTGDSRSMGFDNLSLTSDSSSPMADGSWINTGSGDWNVSTNWDQAVIPNTTNNLPARFGSAITADSVVFTTADVTVNAVQFDNTNRYVIAGARSLHLATTSATPAITVDQGSHEFQLPVKLLADTTVDVASGETLTFNNALDLMGKTLTKTGAGEVSIRNDLITSGGTVNLLQGSVSGNGTISGDFNNDGGTISPGNRLVTETTQAVPEPSSLAMMILSLTIVSALRRSIARIAPI